MRNNLEGTSIGLNNLQLIPLYQLAEERPTVAEPWIWSLWGESLQRIIPSDWFKKSDNLFWSPTPAAADTSLDLFLEVWIQRPYKSHLMVVPQQITFWWRKIWGRKQTCFLLFLLGCHFGDWENMKLL